MEHLIRLKAGLPASAQLGHRAQWRSEMTKSLSRKIRHDVEDTFEDVAKALCEAADTLSDDAEKGVAQAAAALKRAADTLAANAVPQAAGLAKKAIAEVKQHPIASAAAALTAAAALISILGSGRRKAA